MKARERTYSSKTFLLSFADWCKQFQFGDERGSWLAYKELEDLAEVRGSSLPTGVPLLGSVWQVGPSLRAHVSLRGFVPHRELPGGGGGHRCTCHRCPEKKCLLQNNN